jgi:hypothetical protein
MRSRVAARHQRVRGCLCACLVRVLQLALAAAKRRTARSWLSSATSSRGELCRVCASAATTSPSRRASRYWPRSRCVMLAGGLWRPVRIVSRVPAVWLWSSTVVVDACCAMAAYGGARAQAAHGGGAAVRLRSLGHQPALRPPVPTACTARVSHARHPRPFEGQPPIRTARARLCFRASV